MASKKVILLTGEIGSGKTTVLANWSKNRKDVGGILTPISNTERVFYDIKERNIFNMMADGNEEKVLQVGKYLFSQENFKKASKAIQNSLQNPANNFTVIDEVGPLELKAKQGFWEILNYSISNEFSGALIVVIRKSLLNEAQLFFNSNNFLASITNSGSFECEAKSIHEQLLGGRDEIVY